MSQQDYLNNLADGRGHLHQNDKTKDTQPDYRGFFKLNGLIYKVSGWTKDKDGKTMISMQVQEYTENL